MSVIILNHCIGVFNGQRNRGVCDDVLNADVQGQVQIHPVDHSADEVDLVAASKFGLEACYERSVSRLPGKSRFTAHRLEEMTLVLADPVEEEFIDSFNLQVYSVILTVYIVLYMFSAGTWPAEPPGQPEAKCIPHHREIPVLCIKQNVRAIRK